MAISSRINRKKAYYRNLFKVVKDEGMLRNPGLLFLHLRKKSYTRFLRILNKLGIYLTPKVDSVIEAKIELTHECPSKCVTCNFWRTKNISDNSSKKRLEHEDYLRIISKLNDLNCSKLQLLGGEPLLYKRIDELISYAFKKNIKTTMVTNGLLLDEKMAKKLVDSEITGIGFSLDGTRKKNDKIRGVKGAFDKQMSAIRNVQKYDKENNVYKTIMVTVSVLNINELDKILDVAKDAGINELNYFILSAYDDIVKKSSDSVFKKNVVSKEFMVSKALVPKDKELIEKMRKKVIEKARKENIKVRGNFIYGDIDNLSSGRKKERKFCKIPFKFLLVDCYGSVFPCDFIRYSYGDIKDFNNLKDIFKTIQFKEFSKIYMKNYDKINICDYCCFY